MSKKTTLAAGTSPFAHLLSGFRGKKAEGDDKTKGKRAEDETPVDEDGPTDEDEVIDETEVEDVEDEPSEEDRAKKGKKAKGRKAKADDDADDDEQDPEADADDDDADAEEGMDDKEAKAFRRGLAAGRKRENVRASRIFSAAASASRPDLAATLAFTTRNTSAEAGRLMSVAGAAPGRRSALDDRMGQRTEARPGAGGAPSNGKPSFAQRLAAARTKAGRD